jgi:hypothetical protein
MSKAFKNNMSTGVPKMKGFSPKSPGMVAAKAPSQGMVPPMKPHTLMGSMNKSKLPR